MYRVFMMKPFLEFDRQSHATLGRAVARRHTQAECRPTRTESRCKTDELGLRPRASKRPSQRFGSDFPEVFAASRDRPRRRDSGPIPPLACASIRLSPVDSGCHRRDTMGGFQGEGIWT
jgi:hypothetical protein